MLADFVSVLMNEIHPGIMDICLEKKWNKPWILSFPNCGNPECLMGVSPNFLWKYEYLSYICILLRICILFILYYSQIISVKYKFRFQKVAQHGKLFVSWLLTNRACLLSMARKVLRDLVQMVLVTHVIDSIQNHITGTVLLINTKVVTED